MRSLKEIMNKTASHGGSDVAVEERREHSTVDAIDDQFLSWMSKKASEDVVKIADCGAAHGKMKAGEKCRVCGEENKAAAKTASAEARLLAVLRGGATGGADAIAPEAMKVLNSARRWSAAKGMLAGAGLTAGGGALYTKGRRDQRAKTASSGMLSSMTYDPNNENIKSLQSKHGPEWKSILAKRRGIAESSIVEKQASFAPRSSGPPKGSLIFSPKKKTPWGAMSDGDGRKTAGVFGGNEHTRRIERALRSAEKKTGKKTEDLKGWELMRAMDESRPERAKTAGVIENPENLDLLSRVRALAAAQNRALIGDDG